MSSISRVFLVIAIFWSGISYSETLDSGDIDIDLLKHGSKFATWQGIEPDKWATIWLIKRYIAPGSFFLLIPPNEKLPDDAILLDVPEAAIGRKGNVSMFRRLILSANLNAPELKYLDEIIDDIEVNIWDKPNHPHSIWLEGMYRNLQDRYGRDQVPTECYLMFFDRVARLSGEPSVTAESYSRHLSLSTECPGLDERSQEFVGTIDHLNVLREISLGKKVVFIDTREVEEFDENHIPDSEVLRLRDVNADSVKRFLEADLVVPYCVKDFRGFEVAKAMKLLGIKRVATLSPNGLKGWIGAGLPLVKKDGDNNEQAKRALLLCAMEPTQCLKGIAE